MHDIQKTKLKASQGFPMVHDFHEILATDLKQIRNVYILLWLCVTYEFQSESTLYGLPECQGTPYWKQVLYLKYVLHLIDHKARYRDPVITHLNENTLTRFKNTERTLNIIVWNT